MTRWLVSIALALGVARADAADKIALPKLDSHVMDMSGLLPAWDRQAYAEDLDAFRKRSTFAIVVLVVPSLLGEPIEDLAYRAFNTWGIGDKGKDNGVLLVLALGEHEVRIETGKGVGGALTDLQSNEIIRDMAPMLKAGKLTEAVGLGIVEIENALAKDMPAAPPPTTTSSRQQAAGTSTETIVIWVVIGVVLLLSLVSRGFRGALWSLLQIFSIFGGRGGRGRGWGGGGGGGGGGRGGGYSGGGGRSGGGGSSGKY